MTFERAPIALSLAWLLALAGAGAMAGCSLSKPRAGSESHFLMRCQSNDDCGATLSCEAGFCTRKCTNDAACEALATTASCEPLADGAARVCDLRCADVADCASVGEQLLCASDRCRFAEGGGEPQPQPGRSDAGAPGPEAPSPPDPAPSNDGLGGPQPGADSSPPLARPAQMAFKTGYGPDEQVYLRGEDGEVQRVSVWPKASGLSDCVASFSSGGYMEGTGRFASLAFDHTGDFLLLSERVGCGAPDQGNLVIAHDLRSGQSQTVARRAGSELLSDRRLSLSYAFDSESGTDQVRIEEWLNGKLEPMPFYSGQPVDREGPAQLLTMTDRTILLLAGHPALVRREGETFWTQDVGFDSLARLTIGPMAVSPSGTRLCALARPNGESSPLVAVVRHPDGDWTLRELIETRGIWYAPACAFNADETRLMVLDQVFPLEADALGPEGPRVPGFLVAGAHGGGFFGTQMDEVVQLDPDTGETTPRFGAAALFDLCESDGTVPDAWTQVIAPTPARDVVLIKRYCGCLDCDLSGSVALRLDTNTVVEIERSQASHQVYQALWPSAGGAVVITSQGDMPPSPEAGAFFTVDSEGAVDLVSADGVTDVVHGAVVP